MCRVKPLRGFSSGDSQSEPAQFLISSEAVRPDLVRVFVSDVSRFKEALVVRNIEEVLGFTANICFIFNYYHSCSVCGHRKNVFFIVSYLIDYLISSASSSTVTNHFVLISALIKANAASLSLFLVVDSSKLFTVSGRDSSAALLGPGPVVAFLRAVFKSIIADGLARHAHAHVVDGIELLVCAALGHELRQQIAAVFLNVVLEFFQISADLQAPFVYENTSSFFALGRVEVDLLCHEVIVDVGRD